MLRGHEAEVRCVAWRPDGKVLATGSYDQSVRQWGPDGTAYSGFRDLGNSVIDLAFGADSRRLLATLGGGGGVLACPLFDLSTGQEAFRFRGHANTVMAGAFAPDGILAATADANGVIHLWRTADGQPVHRLAGRGGRVLSAGWGSDGAALAWGHTNSYTSDHDRGPLEQTFRLTDPTVGPLPDGSFRRAQPARGELTLERTGETTIAARRAGRDLATLTMTNPYEVILCYTLLPGDRAAVGTNYGLYLFDAATGRQLREFLGHTGTVWAVAPSPDGRYLLSASGDQTVRIWDPDRDEPLLSVFDAEDDWIAWTPEGYYACSPGGERLMGWQVNHGREAMAIYYPAADFHKTFYRPDVIRGLLEAGSVARAMELAGEQRPATTVPENLPPVVLITAPEGSPVTVTAPELEIRARAVGRAGQPITAMRLLVDGRPYEGQQGKKAIARERAEARDVREAWVVQLEPGTHRLAVVAESAVSKATSDEVEVRYEAPQPARPNLYALAVGISAYPDPLTLDYGAADARTLAETLRRKAAPLFGAVEVRVVADRDATRVRIITGFNWLKQRVTDRDVAVVFYSGHGAVDDDGVFYLVPIDVDVDNLAATGVHGDQFKRTLSGMKGRVLVLLDACHAGAADRGIRRKGLAKSLTDDLARELSGEDYGVIVMCSSTGGEASTEDAAVGHGYFTAALAEALTGRADFNRDGLVYSTEVDTYVSDRIKELSGDRQHPVTAKPASVRPFALTRP